MGNYCAFKETVLKILEIQDDEWPLKAISSGIQIDNAKRFLKVLFGIQTLQLVFFNPYDNSV